MHHLPLKYATRNPVANSLWADFTTTPRTAVGLRPEKDYNSLLQLDAQLESWKEELPSFLRFGINNQSSDPTNLFVRQANLLHHR